MKNSPKKAFKNEEDDTKLKLIKVGLKLIGQKGFEGTSLREISQQSGQNLASISYHFGDKQGFYAEIIEYISLHYAHLISEISQEAENLCSQPVCEDAAIVDIIKRLIATLTVASLSKVEAFSSGINIILREQINPTAVFPLIYLKTYLPIQKLICKLLARLLRKDEDGEDLVIFSYGLISLSLFYRTNLNTINTAISPKSLGQKILMHY